jgi:hypothetical protein
VDFENTTVKTEDQQEEEEEEEEERGGKGKEERRLEVDVCCLRYLALHIPDFDACLNF